MSNNKSLHIIIMVKVHGTNQKGNKVTSYNLFEVCNKNDLLIGT